VLAAIRCRNPYKDCHFLVVSSHDGGANKLGNPFRRSLPARARGPALPMDVKEDAPMAGRMVAVGWAK